MSYIEKMCFVNWRFRSFVQYRCVCTNIRDGSSIIGRFIMETTSTGICINPKNKHIEWKYVLGSIVLISKIYNWNWAYISFRVMLLIYDKMCYETIIMKQFYGL